MRIYSNVFRWRRETQWLFCVINTLHNPMKKTLQISLGLYFIIMPFRILYFMYVIITKISRNDVFFNNKRDSTPLKNTQCLKSVHIRIFSCPYFPAFVLNTDRYEVSLCNESECGKMRTRKNPAFWHSLGSDQQLLGKCWNWKKVSIRLIKMLGLLYFSGANSLNWYWYVVDLGTLFDHNQVDQSS